MSKTLTPAGGPAAARRSKVDRSRRILAGTSTAATTALLLWLVVAALSGRPVVMRSSLVLGVEPTDAVVGVLPTVAADADVVADSIGQAGIGPAADLAELERQIGGMAAAGGSGPRVVYLSAVGVSSAGPEGASPYFLPIGGDPAAPTSLIPAGPVIELLADRSRMGGPALLILDVAHLDTDRGTGVFANSFLHRIKDLVPEGGDLVVLTSCAPGQVSWSAGPFGRSVFADCVARSDAWGRGTVSALHEDVASRVAAWARLHRGAVQTPMLLGNARRRDFRLPPLRGTPPEAVPPAASEELTSRLREAWAAHQAIAAAGPHRVAPLSWRRHRDGLLRADRLVRAGRHAEAELALNAVDSIAAAVRQELDAAPPAGLPSSALRIAMAGPGQREALSREWEAQERAIRRIFDGSAPAVGLVDPPTVASASAEGAEATPAGPGAVGDDGADSPTANPALPDVAEALLARRYAQFVGLGGESDDLRPERLKGLSEAFDAAVAAERAAAVDGRLLPWIAPIVDEGDRERLKGQDLLFAADLGPIREAREPIRRASARYAEAIALAGPLAEAIDLLQELVDVLPYHGEWAAVDPARHTLLVTLTDEAAGLADRVAGPPTGRDAAGAPLDELRARLAKVRGGYAALRRAFDQEVAVAGRPGARTAWRKLDALLQVPTIAVDARMALVAAASAAELSPLPARAAPGFGSEEPAADEGFWARALGLARLELGLLRIAGEPVDELRAYLGSAETWRTAPASAFDAMDSLSQGVRRHRDAMLGLDGRNLGAARAGRGDLDRADWLARALPAEALHQRFGASENPGAGRSARDRHGLLVWHGRRLTEDLALELARDALLAASSLGVDTQELADARLGLNDVQSQAIRVEALASGEESAGKSPGLVASGGQSLPPGLAAVLLKRDPTTSLQARPRGEAVVATPIDGRAERRFDIQSAAGFDVVPALFYRGQVFDAGRISIPQIEQVSVAIRQLRRVAVDKNDAELVIRGRTIKILDQFEEHPDEGYLHPNSWLEYRLDLTNWTSDPLPVVVTQRWEDELARDTRVELPPGQNVVGAAVGQASSIDFGPDNAPRTLNVEVREAGGTGRVLSKKQVVFRVLSPDQYIAVAPHFKGGRIPQVGLFVHHLDTDRTTVPSLVTVAIEPFAAVRQVAAPEWIERGAYETYRYLIVDPKVQRLKFSLNIDGVSDAIVREFVIQELREEPAPPPPPQSPMPGAPGMPRL